MWRIEMKKFYLTVLIVLISLFAVCAVSAADSDNITDDSAMSLSNEDLQSVAVEAEDNISSGDRDVPDVDVDDVDSVYGDNVTIPFKVSDSKGSLISGDVNVSVKNEDNAVSKIIKIDNGQFEMADLIDILKASYKWNISDVFDIINGSANITNSNFSMILSGVEDIYNGLGINASVFIKGIENLINGSDVNISELMEGLGDITRAFNVTDFIDGANSIINIFDLEFSDWANAWDIVLGGFDLNFTDLWNKFSHGVYFNMPMLNEGWSIINEEFAISSQKSPLDIFKDLGLKISLSSSLKLLLLNLKSNVYLYEITDLADEILEDNHLTPLEFMEKLYNQNDGFNFNITDIICKIRDSQINIDNVENGAEKIIDSIHADWDVINLIFDSIKECRFNSSKVIDELNNMSSLNISSFNASEVLKALKKIIDSASFNTSGITEGLDKIIAAFSFYNPSIKEGFDKINSSFSYNESRVIEGLDKIVRGMGINVSSAVGSIIAKYGYFATFPTLASGVYNITVEYLSNDDYASAVNNTAKLIVQPKIDSPMTLDVAVDALYVTVTGHMDLNATGVVLFVVGNYTYIVPVKNGNFTLKRSIMPGNYNATAVYLGDSSFNKINASVAFTVKSPTSIVASQVSTTYGTAKNLVITLKDWKSNPVSGKSVAITFNGKTYYRTTDAKGQVSISVSNNLIPKTYVASLVFDGDDSYIKAIGSVKVVVSKVTPKLTAKKKTFKVKVKVKKYSIILKNNNGKVMKKVKLTLKVNGKTYVAKTTSKGKATFKIVNLKKKGTFKATVTYKGNSYYNKVTKKVNIKIK